MCICMCAPVNGYMWICVGAVCVSVSVNVSMSMSMSMYLCLLVCLLFINGQVVFSCCYITIIIFVRGSFSVVSFRIGNCEIECYSFNCPVFVCCFVCLFVCFVFLLFHHTFYSFVLFFPCLVWSFRK